MKTPGTASVFAVIALAAPCVRSMDGGEPSTALEDGLLAWFAEQAQSAEAGAWGDAEFALSASGGPTTGC